MTIAEALDHARAMTGQVFDDAALVRWLSELDGRLALELGWMPRPPYDPEGSRETALLAPFPWDGLYVHHLEAMTYYSNGEYDRYENARAMAERKTADWRAYLRRTGNIREEQT